MRVLIEELLVLEAPASGIYLVREDKLVIELAENLVGYGLCLELRWEEQFPIEDIKKESKG